MTKASMFVCMFVTGDKNIHRIKTIASISTKLHDRILIYIAYFSRKNYVFWSQIFCFIVVNRHKNHFERTLARTVREKIKSFFNIERKILTL